MRYDYTVAAVLSVLPNADIGPGNIIDPVKTRKWKSWGTEIIDHCANGTNHVTGQIGTRLGFFGSSYYTAVGTTDERFDDLVHVLRSKLDEHAQFADAPHESTHTSTASPVPTTRVSAITIELPIVPALPRHPNI